MTAAPSARGPVRVLDPGGLTALDDHALMAATRDGSDEAFEAFYTRHKPGVLSFCRHILGNREDAEDAVQHTFVATYRHVEAEGPPAHPSAWLYRVARNRCLTMIRARHESPQEWVDPATAGLAEEVEQRFELRALLRDVSRLPEEQRAALILFELGGLTQTEIGEVLESSPDKVKALVYQARHSLMDRAVARETDCREIRRRLSTLRGGRLNDRTLRHHLDVCAGCRLYRDEMALQRRGLALLLPVVPLVDVHQRIFALLGIGGAGGAVGGGGASTGAAASPHGWSHLGSQSTGVKAVAAGAAVTAASAALAFSLGGEDVQPVPEPAVAAPVTAPAPAREQAPRPRRRVAPSRRRARPTARPAAATPAPIPAAAPAPPKTTPREEPAARPRAPREAPTPPRRPQPQPTPPPAVTAPPAAPAPEPAPAPEVAPPAPVVPGSGHRNGPPGPVGNPQPNGPPPGLGPGKPAPPGKPDAPGKPDKTKI